MAKRRQAPRQSSSRRKKAGGAEPAESANQDLQIDEAWISTELEKRERLYDALVGEARFILEDRLNELGIKIHAVEGRVKSRESIVTKCKSKGIRDPFEDLPDLAGCRVICLFRSDIERIGKMIDGDFEIIEVDDKIFTSTDSFGYMSVHYIVRLKDNVSGPRYERIKGIKMEIQVRSLAMHAWAAISHYLSYKGEWDVPDKLKKSLNALSAIFYLADSEFEQFYAESEKSRTSVELDTAEDINLDTVTALLREMYPERTRGSNSSTSELVQEIKLANYSTISEVKHDLRRSQTALEEYETNSSSSFPHHIGFFNDVGAARASLSIASQIFEENRTEKGARDYGRFRVHLSTA